jgi:hypothetical protein
MVRIVPRRRALTGDQLRALRAGHRGAVNAAAPVDDGRGAAPVCATLPPMDPHAPVITDEDLLQRWRDLMGPGGFGGRSLWLAWFADDGRQLPLVVPVEDVPARPEPLLVRNLVQLVHSTVADLSPAAWAAAALSRPGPRQPCEDDRAWGRALRRTAAEARVPLRPLHLATPGHVAVLRPDDLV